MLKKSLAVMLLALPLAAFPSKTGLTPGVYEYATSTDGGAPEKTRHCVTPQEADQGFVPGAPGTGCRTPRSTLAGGKIDILQVCKDSTMSATGSYTATSFVVDGRMQAKVGNQTVNATTHTVGKRVGDTCKGDED